MRALFKAMRNVCQKYPYIFKRKVRETKNKAEEEDTIGSIECQDKNCGVKYVVRRRKGWIASYLLSGGQTHNHQLPSQLKRGLSMEAKRILIQNLNCKTPASAQHLKRSQ